MLNSSKVWPVTTKQERNITSTETKYLRNIVGKTKKDKTRNENIRGILNQKPIVTK